MAAKFALYGFMNKWEWSGREPYIITINVLIREVAIYLSCGEGWNIKEKLYRLGCIDIIPVGLEKNDNVLQEMFLIIVLGKHLNPSPVL